METVRGYVKLMILVVVLLAGSEAGAKDIHVLVNEASRAWKEAKYADSQNLLQRVVDAYGERGKRLFGSKFGEIYYRKGMTELKLASQAKRVGNIGEARKWFAQAKESFRVCYEEFGNR